MAHPALSQLLNRTPYAAHWGQRWLGFSHTRGLGGKLSKSDEVSFLAVAILAVVNLLVLSWLSEQPATTSLVYGFYLAFAGWHLHQVGRSVALRFCGGPLTRDDVIRLHDWMRVHPCIAEYAAHWMGGDELLRKRDYHLIRRVGEQLSKKEKPTKAQKSAERQKEREQAEQMHSAVLKQWRAQSVLHPWPSAMTEQEKKRCEKARLRYIDHGKICVRRIQTRKAPVSAYVGASSALSGAEAFAQGLWVSFLAFIALFVFLVLTVPLAFVLPTLDFSEETLTRVVTGIIPIVGAISLAIAVLGWGIFMHRWYGVWRFGVAEEEVLQNLQGKLFRHPTLLHDTLHLLPEGASMTPEHVWLAHQAFKSYQAYLDRMEEEQAARQISDSVRALPAVKIAQAHRQAQDLDKATAPVAPQSTPGARRI